MRLVSLSALLGVLSLCACSSEPSSPPPPGPGGAHFRGRFADRPPADADGEEGPRRNTLFISPSGEPFRGQPGEPYPVAAWFAQADKNHDGKLDRDEFVADAVRFFAVLDQNGDNQIDGEELSYYEHTVAPEILSRGPMGAAGDAHLVLAAYDTLDQGGMGGGMGGGGMGGGGGGGGRGGGGRHGGGGGPPSGGGGGPPAGASAQGAVPYSLLQEPEPVAASDLSFSGRISLTDFRRRADQRFDLLDPDQKGFLELASLPKTMVQSGSGRGGRRRRPPA